MDPLAIFIAVFAFTGSALAMYDKWLLKDGRIFYWLMAAVSASHLCVEILTVLRDPALWSMLLYLPLEIWTLTMAYKGWRRQNGHDA